MIRIVTLGLAALALVGCSQFGGLYDAQQRQQRWQAQQQALSGVDHWDIHARAAISLEGEAYNIGLRWQRDSDRFSLLLEAPFGQGVFRIDSRPDGSYRLRLPDGQVFSNDSPEALLEEVIGWAIPISGLEYWIRGLPQPNSSYSHRIDSAGRARSIQQDKWTIEYLDFFTQQAHPQLPRKIKLVRNEVTLKLVIERWQQAEFDDSSSDLFPEFN